MRRVLVVDDNLAMAENLAEVITDAEVGDPVVADSGARALALLNQGRFDVLVTDMRMPGIDGAQLIALARELDPDLAVVVMTAFIGSEQMEQASRQGLLAVLAKPVPLKPLLSLLERAQRARPVLIIEDNVPLAENLTESLRERGLASVTAHSLAEIERVAGAPSVALVDLRVPGGGDGAALARVTERFPDAALVIMTAFRAELPSLPQVPVFEKPFDTLNLMELVERLSSRPRASA